MENSVFLGEELCRSEKSSRQRGKVEQSESFPKKRLQSDTLVLRLDVKLESRGKTAVRERQRMLRATIDNGQCRSIGSVSQNYVELRRKPLDKPKLRQSHKPKAVEIHRLWSGVKCNFVPTPARDASSESGLPTVGQSDAKLSE